MTAAAAAGMHYFQFQRCHDIDLSKTNSEQRERWY
jgi:hypothetical protein